MVLSLEQALRAAWSFDRFGRARAPDHGDEEKSVRAEKADKAITSPYWWGYAHMVDMVVEVLAIVQGWSESCRCHFRMPNLEGASRHRCGIALFAAIGSTMCPLRGCNAAACAAGHLLVAVGGDAIGQRGVAPGSRVGDFIGRRPGCHPLGMDPCPHAHNILLQSQVSPLAAIAVDLVGHLASLPRRRSAVCPGGAGLVRTHGGRRRAPFVFHAFGGARRSGI